MTFSRVTLAGVVASQPEKRFTPNNTAVTSFELQVTPPARGSNQPQPYTLLVTCWARTAETVAEQVQMGATVLVEGRLQTKVDAQADGTQKKTFEIDAQQVVVVNGSMFNTGADQNIGGGATVAPQPMQQQPMQQPMMAGGGMPPQQQPMAAPPQQPAYTDDDIPF